MMEHLFVYGTLAPGESNERFLKKIKGTWQKASTRGRFINNLPYKNCVCVDTRIQDERSEGQLFSSRQLRSMWKTLDDFEGSGYQRETCLVTLTCGKTVKAHIYAYNPAYKQNRTCWF